MDQTPHVAFTVFRWLPPQAQIQAGTMAAWDCQRARGSPDVPGMPAPGGTLHQLNKRALTQQDAAWNPKPPSFFQKSLPGSSER